MYFIRLKYYAEPDQRMKLIALNTVGKKSIRALEIVLAIFLCFECQFLSFYACYKEYKA